MTAKKFLPFAILLISISTVTQWCDLPIDNTTIWWLLDAIILLCLYKLGKSAERITPIYLFQICVFVSFIYGAIFQTENYWDWKLLIGNAMVFSLPLVVYAFDDSSLLRMSLSFWLRYAWIVLVILIPFLQSDAFGRFLCPYTLLALFFPLLNKKNISFVLIAYVITLMLGTESRSDVLKFTICLIMGFLVWKPIFKPWILRLFRPFVMALWITPVIFFILGATGIFNIFKIEEELGIEGKYQMQSSGEEISALADTRTFLYREEIKSAIDNNYIVQGRSMARGYDSAYFGAKIDEVLGVKRGERGSCETSILNIFNYFGLIGVFLYFAVFVGASYMAVYKSNNIYIPVVGLYVAFRWMFGWIEDFSRFDLNYMFLWIMIGMCYSSQFRRMTNMEFKQWAKSLTTY